MLLVGCQEPLEHELADPEITIIATIDPDTTSQPDPTPAYVVWVSTYSGSVLYYVNGEQPGGRWGDSAQGGELMIVEVPLTVLTPNDSNQFEIRLQPTDGGQVITQGTTIFAGAF
jgi:hypothetical protein